MKTTEKTLFRRNVLKEGAIGIAAAVVAAKVASKVSSSKPQKTKRYAMVIDLRRCVGCYACALACKSEFQVPVGGFRAWVRVKEEGKYPKVKKYFLPRHCNHCLDSQCVTVCPTGASHVREIDGVVNIDKNKCIGCGSCVAACPYNCRYKNKNTNTVDKCDFCLHRVEKGVVPSCVNTCPSEARTFGDLNDPNSAVSSLLKKNTTRVLKPELGTKPYVFYIPESGRNKII